MQRGELWWATLPEPKGSEPRYRSPVLIVSSNRFNESRINTVVVAAIASNIRLGNAPGNIQLPAKGSGLTKASIVNVSQLATLDKTFLTKRIGRLTRSQLECVDEGLRLVLGL